MANFSYRWPFARSIIPGIEKSEYDDMNNHLPKLYTVKDYSIQLFTV